MSEIRLAALSPTMEEGRIAKWHVGPGDPVRPGQLLVEVETDKATIEVEAEVEGRIEALLAVEGSDVPVGAPIARLVSAGQHRVAPILDPGPPAAVAADPEAIQPDPAPRAPAGARLAERIARQAGLEAEPFKGADARRALDLLARTLGSPALPEAAPAPASAATGDATLIPLSTTRRTIARRTAESFRDIPHFPLCISVRLDAAEAFRAQLNAGASDGVARVTLNDLVLFACARTLARVPEANTRYTPDGLQRLTQADIGIAVAAPEGLAAPVLRGVQRMGLRQIAVEARALAERARSGALRPDDLVGGSMTVSNLGMYGVSAFASILNPPQALILSVGAAERRPRVVGDAVVIATEVTVTLTCDHRAVDGALGAAWLSAFRQMLEDPLLLMA